MLLSELGRGDAEARKIAAVYATSRNRQCELKQLRSVEPPHDRPQRLTAIDLQ